MKKIHIERSKIEAVEEVVDELLAVLWPQMSALVTDLSTLSDFTIGWPDDEWRYEHSRIRQEIKKRYGVEVSDDEVFSLPIYKIAIRIVQR